LQKEGTNLIYLNLEGNRLHLYALETICEQISNNRTVRILNLSRNHITSQACQAITNMLEENNTLKELYLRWNLIKGEGGGTKEER